MRSLGHQNRTTSRTIGPRNRKNLALAMMLALCLVTTFVVLADGEAWGAEQPSQTTQPGTLQSTTMINGKVAEPVGGTTPPPVEIPTVVETSPVEMPPAQTPPAQTPPPPTNETPPAKEPSPPPVDPAPSTPEPEPSTPQPAPQWFAVVITDGEIVESDPVLTTSWSTTDPAQTPDDVSYPTPGTAAPVEDTGSSVPSTSPDAWPLGSAVDEAMPTDQRATEPLLGPVASNQVPPEGAAAALLPETVRGLVPGSFISRDTAPQPAPSMFDKSPAAVPLVQTVPASVGEALRLPSSLGTTAASAVGTVRSMAASVSSATTELLGFLAGFSPGTTSSTNSTDGTQGQPSEGTPQPAPAPLAPLVGGGSFSPLTGGGGQSGLSGGFVPLLLGILALAGIMLSRRDFRTYLVSCEMPKPSSALLLPLERPG